MKPSLAGASGRSHEQPTAPLACLGLQGQVQASAACGPFSGLDWAGLGWSGWSGQEASLGAWPCLAVSGAALVPVEWGVGSGVSSQSGSH